jgi:small-conductance mechanosensitive channel
MSGAVREQRPGMPVAYEAARRAVRLAPSSQRSRVIRIACALAFLVTATAAAVATTATSAAAQDLSQVVSSATPGQTVVLRYNNRPITTLRATILSRSPAERAAGAVEVLDRIVDEGRPGAISTRRLQGVAIVSVGERDVFTILPLDVNELAGETQDSKAAEAIARLQQALDEAVELRTPRRILTSVGLALLGTAIFVLLLRLTLRLRRVLVVWFGSRAERQLQHLSAGDELFKASRATFLVQRAVTTGIGALWLLLGYSWLTFTLRRFPYFRPWGESLRSFLLDRIAFVGLKIVGGIPDLFTVLLILLTTRFLVRVFQAVFQSAEDGRVALPYVHPETAQPTRRIVSALLWLLGLVLAYPYLPGSNSDAFKGVSVFLGLVLSLGSSGIVNQMMSGLTITYSRALRPGDFVKIGEVEGTVTHLGGLSTKVKTSRSEEVTIPNAVVLSYVTTNYSRFADSDGVFVPTTLTIGYDTPWRQIHALLLLAAARTPGVRPDPKPVVRQTALQDFYVQYTLLVCLESPHLRVPTLDALHANIQDAFNEYGVQIMSPNYEADPIGRKVVPVDQWYAAPAGQPEGTAGQFR